MGDPKRILVVDDDPDFNSSLSAILKKNGFNTEAAYDGKEGLEKMRADRPDLVILDVMMPVMDGYTACRTMKGDDALADIPVILLTAVGSHISSTKYTHQDGMDTEADDYVSKPTTPEEILRSVKNLLE